MCIYYYFDYNLGTHKGCLVIVKLSVLQNKPPFPPVFGSEA